MESPRRQAAAFKGDQLAEVLLDESHGSAEIPCAMERNHQLEDESWHFNICSWDFKGLFHGKKITTVVPWVPPRHSGDSSKTITTHGSTTNQFGVWVGKRFETGQLGG